MKVTARDRNLLRQLVSLKFLTIDQASIAVYENRNVAQRRLQMLETISLINSIPLSDGHRGQPTKLHYLNWDQRKKMVPILGQDILEGQLIRSLPENLVRVRHAMEVNQVIVCLLAGCRHQGLSFSYITEHELVADRASKSQMLMDEVEDPGCPGRVVKFRRDAIGCIASERGKALFEIELDRGNEAITTSSHRAITLGRKIQIFIQSVNLRRFERYSAAEFFGHPFKVSRLLLVTTSAERVAHIASFCLQINTHGLVYLTTLAEITPQAINAPIWRVPDNGVLAAKPLIK
jgi:hypothetical protein